MKIHFRNFRCYIDDTFEFDTKGLQLLSGESGNGKTTILEGILFVLYDAVKCPYTFSSKPKDKCYIELFFEPPLKDVRYIYRSRRPNIVKVKTPSHEYEQTEAQAIIDMTFGTLYEFMASSYVKQGLHSSILTLTPGEQLKFIERLAYGKEGHEQITKCIKEALLLTSRDLDNAKITYNLISIQYNDLKTRYNLSQVPPNKPNISAEDTNVAIKEISEKLTFLKKSKTELQRKIERAKSISVELEKLVDKERILRIEVSQLEQRIIPIVPTLTIEQRSQLEADTEDLNKSISLANKVVKYNEAKNAYETALKETNDEKISSLKSELVTQEFIDNLNKLETKEKDILILKEKINNANGIITNIFKELDTIIKIRFISPKAKLNSLIRIYNKTLNEIEEVQKLIEVQVSNDIRSKVYECPCCSAKISIDINGIMIKYTSDKVIDNKEDVVSLRGKLSSMKELSQKISVYIQTLKDNIPIISMKVPASHEKVLVQMRSKYENHKRATKELENVSSYTNKTLQRLKKSMDTLFIDKNPNINIEESIKKLNENNKILEHEWKLSSEYNLVKREITEKRETMDGLKRAIQQIYTSNNLTKTLETLGSEYEEVQTQIEETMTYLEHTNNVILEWEKYNEYEKSLKHISELASSTLEAKKSITFLEKKTSAIIALKNISKKAEVLSLNTIINNINEHAKYYINMMFPDETMSAILTIIRKTKKDIKFEMNVLISYKGSEYGDINQLSGGERDRINLCFVLAVNNMVNSHILMLDESLASLDAQCNTEIFTMLREIASNKCVLIVSHEATRGIFDKVYTFNNT